MKIFKINERASIVCESKKTRIAFKHEAVLLVNGMESDRTKICYQNRTWETFEYESAIIKLLDKTNYLNQEERKAFMDKCAGKANAESEQMLSTIGMVAKMGEVLCAGDQKATNDWKERMLKAGLQNKGLIMPEDWESLSEDEKTVRLDSVIGQLTKK